MRISKTRERSSTDEFYYLSLAQKNQWDKVYESLSLGTQNLKDQTKTELLNTYIASYLSNSKKDSKAGTANIQLIEKVCKEFLNTSQQAKTLSYFSYKQPYFFNLVAKPKETDLEFLDPWLSALAGLVRQNRYANVWLYLKHQQWDEHWRKFIDANINTPDGYERWNKITHGLHVSKEMGKTSWMQIFSSLNEIWQTQNQNVKINKEKTLLGLSLTRNKWAGSKLLIEEGGSITKCGCNIKIDNIISGRTVPTVNSQFTYPGEEEKLAWVVNYIKSQYEKNQVLDAVEIIVRENPKKIQML